MKKLFLFFILFFSTLNITAQTPSLANIQTLWKKQKVSSISTQLRSWGYKLISVSPLNDTTRVAGTACWMNNIYYNNTQEGWDSKNVKAINTIAVRSLGSITSEIVWQYQSSAIHNSIKNQIKNAGWKYLEDYVINNQIVVYYSNKNSGQTIELRESADSGYSFVYRFKFDDE